MTAPTGLDAAIEYHVANSLGWPGLRPLQTASVKPVRSGTDCVLVAPTAGGKTEAALFPLLSEMVQGNWSGTSVLYVTPLRALLNNLYPRLIAYGSWLGRSVGLWHGDVGQSERRRMLADRPDILLTTPESLEAMLVSRRVDHERFLGSVRAVVIDELHAFAASDRGWHLLAVLERVERIAGHKIQRVGLSATVGNPDTVGVWMQGSTSGRGPVAVVREDSRSPVEPEVTLDYVGSMENAATVISRLHRGEKRLVFAESRRSAEELAFLLRERDVQTYVSHSSLSADERQVSELAFAEAKDTVIVATSTLELGIDIGDLDRVIQIDAPRTVSSFLQRLGRTGRRPGTSRNTLFLATSLNGLLDAAAVLLLWKRGFVEDVVAPPHPRHLAAQQLLALALQEGEFGASDWSKWWGDLQLMADGEEVLGFLREREFLVEDSGLLMIGPRAEKEFGKRHFMDLLSTFVADLELRVVAGTKEIGFISPLAIPLSAFRSQRPLVLAGRGWHIRSVDWSRFTVWVEEVSTRGEVRWPSSAVAQSFELCQAKREVLLGADPAVNVSKRVRVAMHRLRDERTSEVNADGVVMRSRASGGARLWTWAGLKANATLLAGLGVIARGVENESVVLPDEIKISDIRRADPFAVPQVDAGAITGLKFSVALPFELAGRTLGERLSDAHGARATAGAAIVRLMD
ncbi:DEAD/DEAH box helicase [Rhodococcus sp. BP-149]|uniref:DEAD/DEAH box helicase n=1 Tax=unclassified Rhodococcus (in: high G+C Gram-positive bacteria) TaxID=192944 RepID=UPI001C9A7E0F|nr:MULTISPECIES: DEAD/DEAH box helicase [unclassified Rhodococcus (in: high G+C Gram-positive bacteria)]MBY6687227.1 DEAD/DEAH box helicase [Rhodococcus sp. BP-288]MBY6694350.1 DEAD/DEAH box helicase [Rhodococcus sp. BP-188]MBY6698059.1 DEAD/DEAH box helicase [Rhodococcus sp. BP-285]MBY6704279.1 DEAD/DEAH box helicase [Rhodococcus sp. BP-283]MBY6712928.1 DEAD/DEAH box helicase [Rhodococcus sp. BP-160]